MYLSSYKVNACILSDRNAYGSKYQILRVKEKHIYHSSSCLCNLPVQKFLWNGQPSLLLQQLSQVSHVDVLRYNLTFGHHRSHSLHEQCQVDNITKRSLLLWVVK